MTTILAFNFGAIWGVAVIIAVLYGIGYVVTSLKNDTWDGKEHVRRMNAGTIKDGRAPEDLIGISESRSGVIFRRHTTTKHYKPYNTDEGNE